jgi:DNA modification methylase
LARPRPIRIPARDRSSGLAACTLPPCHGATARTRHGIGRADRRHPNGRNPGDVWSIPTRPYRGPHFAAFPPEIPTRCIKAGSKPGGMVLDPFTGVGSTGLAVAALGRRFTGIDLIPEFAAIAAERLRHAAEDLAGNGTSAGSGNCAR